MILFWNKKRRLLLTTKFVTFSQLNESNDNLLIKIVVNYSNLIVIFIK